MLRRLLLPLSLLCALAFPAGAERIVLGLSQDEVAITATFEGSDILIYGAVSRDAPVPSGDMGIIIAVSGPLEPVTVRRKERKFGIWVNADAVEVDAAPSFYAVATSAPFSDVLKDVEDLRHKISIPRAIRAVGTGVSDSENFTEALIRVRENADLYQVLENTVSFEQGTLFGTAIALPANLTEGMYSARIFLTRDGEVVDEYVTSIPVNKVGIERWLYELAHNSAMLYGIMSLAIAIAAGWGASAAFAALRR
jgi:uncharacterized protein (TIGR02186 family)